MRINKIIFTAAQLSISLSINIKMTKVDIFFSKFDQFVTLRLNTNKTNLNHVGILIVMIQNRSKIALRQYFANCTLFMFCLLIHHFSAKLKRHSVLNTGLIYLSLVLLNIRLTQTITQAIAPAARENNTY